MLCCLNPNCPNPVNPNERDFCQSCGTLLILLKNRYRPLKNLGGSGFSRTYLAEDLQLQNKPCLIQQFAPPVQGKEAIAQAISVFEQEAKLLRELGQHPQIPNLLAYFQEINYLYLVQEFIQGPNLLTQLEEQGTFSEAKIRQLLIETLGILEFVHQRGGIHQDIKPKNIIGRLPSQSDSNLGRLVLINFGIAQKLTVTSISQPGITIGSFGYVPIEQMQGERVYPSSDLYSLGTTCFHLLTGIHPWELWKRQGYGWVANWQQYLSQALGSENAISAKLVRILDKLLQENHQQRYQSADAVLRELNPQPSLPPEITQAVFPPPQTTLPANQNTAQINTVTTPSTQISPPSTTATATAVSPRQTAPAPSPNSVQANIFTKRLFLLAGVFLITALGGYWYWQSKVISISAPPKTNEQVSSLTETNSYEDIPVLYTLEQHQDYVYDFAITPDNQTLVSVGGDKAIRIWDLKTGQLKNTLTGHSREIYTVALSPDGKSIYTGSNDNTIRVWNLETGEMENILNGHKSDVFSIAITQDGKTLVSGSNDSTIKIWDLETEEVKNTLEGHESFVYSVAISPDGKNIVSGSNDNTIKIWNLPTGELKRTLTGHQDWIKAVAISPDGKNIVSGSIDGTIKIWDLETGKLKKDITVPDNWIRAVTVSSDSQLIISGGDDETVQLWDLNTGELKNTLTGHTGYVIAVAISPDDKTIVSGSRDETIKIWQIR